MTRPRVSVLKFGGSVLVDDAALDRVLLDVYREIRLGRRVVAVVSAQEGTTDRLDERARALTSEPEESLYAAFLATAEVRSGAALALAAERAGIDTCLLDGPGLGIETVGLRLEADPVKLDSDSLEAAIQEHWLVVVPGFVGVGSDGAPTLLGRGGSDMTAIFLAAQLKAERCALVKDVDGWFVDDPRQAGMESPRFAGLHWDEAISIPAPIVQDRAVVLARELDQPFEVVGLGSTGATRVGSEPTRIEQPAHTVAPIDVVVLGCGTVGSGVVRHLFSLPDRYRIRAILVGDTEKVREDWIPSDLLTTDRESALSHENAVVVELIGGMTVARPLVEKALTTGRSVVTANKKLIAELQHSLEALAECNGSRLVYSAAVGGSAPMLETVRTTAVGAGVRSLRGILNGTCNWILDAMAKGLEYEEALDEAQRRGFAEADPTADVRGLDAAHKLVLLARSAGRSSLQLKDIAVSGIESITEHHREDWGDRRPRLVGTLRLGASGDDDASVALEWLGAEDPLFDISGSWGALDIEATEGLRVTAVGRGAGRWPTALAVMADVEDTRNHLQVRRSAGEQAREARVA